MLSFNVLSRRAGGEEGGAANPFLATRMQFNKPEQRVSLERFKVFSAPDSLVVERIELNLAKRIEAVELFRKRPKHCEIHLESGKNWEFVFESNEVCRGFSQSVKGIVCVDGEYYLEDEKAYCFRVKVNSDVKATLLLIGSSIFLKSNDLKVTNSSSPWLNMSSYRWTRKTEPNVLTTLDENGDLVTIEFRERAARERFLGRLQQPSMPLRLFTGSWNVGNAAAPTPRELARSWLDLALPTDQRCFDLYVFGLQECSKRDEWVRTLGSAVAFHVGCEPEEISRVALVTMREIVLAVYAHVKLPIRVLGQDSRATGIANTIGNKGAVGIGLDLYGYGTLAVISAHLSAFQDNVKRRAQDQRMILKHLNLMNNQDEEAQIRLRKNLVGCGDEEFDNVETFDRVAFLGDLNYRVDMGSSGTLEEFERVELMARGGRWAELAPYDQLITEMSKERVFFGFHEVMPLGSFPPTYRMNKDQQGYSNKRDQNPSFTDRILLRGAFNGSTYGANHELVVRPDRILTISDHRPIYAALELNEENSGSGFTRTEGAKEKDLVLNFKDVTFRSSCTVNMNDRTIIDENSRLVETVDSPAEAKLGTPLLKRKLSGMTSSRYLLRRQNSSGTTSCVASEEADDLAANAFDEELAWYTDENVDLKISAPWSIDYPTITTIMAGAGRIHTFVPLEHLRQIPMTIGVYSRPHNLVGYARFVLPETVKVDEPLPLEIPVGSRGARVGDLVLQLTLTRE